MNSLVSTDSRSSARSATSADNLLYLDSTYTVNCICNLFSECASGIHVYGNSTSAKAGCKNNTAKSQNTWTISVQSNKTDSTIVSEEITYAVEWK
ncbi:MAG TPA: hypothetical protein VHO70_08455 [Chitinispirillaceae bacterium]|nr:hypothetical protein [Chitinispirillaceae bacterium]